VLALLAMVLALCAAGWMLASMQQNAKAAAGDPVTLQYGPDGYFSTLTEGVVGGWGVYNSRDISFGKQGYVNDNSTLTQDTDYGVLAIGPQDSSVQDFFSNGDGPNRLETRLSFNTALNPNEALLWAKDVVAKSNYTVNTSNRFDGAGYQSPLAEDSSRLTGSNGLYSDFEKSLMRGDPVDGVSTLSTGCVNNLTYIHDYNGAYTVRKRLQNFPTVNGGFALLFWSSDWYPFSNPVFTDVRPIQVIASVRKTLPNIGYGVLICIWTSKIDTVAVRISILWMRVVSPALREQKSLLRVE
jgi:hypothetical protein